MIPKAWLKIAARKAGFDQLIKWFRDRLPLSDPEFRKLDEQARYKAWWLAQVTQVSVVDDAMQSLGKAKQDGITFQQWKAEQAPKIQAEWGVGAQDIAGREFDQPARLQLIWNNATNKAYSDARYEQMNQPDMLDLLPYKKFDTVMDDRTSEICEPLNGTVLPSDDPWWDDHNPPLHHNCRSGVYPMSQLRGERALAKAEQQGKVYPPPDAPAVPQGWGRAPGGRPDDATIGLQNKDPALVHAAIIKTPPPLPKG